MCSERDGMSALDAVDGSHHRHRNSPDFDRPRGAARVCLWLQADMQLPEIDFRSSPNTGRGGGRSRESEVDPKPTSAGICLISAMIAFDSRICYRFRLVGGVIWEISV